MLPKKPWILAAFAFFVAPLSIGSLVSLTGCGKKADNTASTSSPTPSAKSATSADAIQGLNVGQIPQQKQPEPIPPPPDVAAPPSDAQKTASGLATKVLTKGTATAHPAAMDKVQVNYTGWTTDGKMFDSSVARGQPASFSVNQVIPGWTEGLQLMVVGEKRRMWIPANLAYGPRGMPGIPANSALTFDVELLDITPAPKPPPVPTDVAAAPANATKTASGLAYRMLTPGKDPNAAKPGPTSMVQVNYSGWTTDGKMFDSSITRGQPARFPLNRVIKGWTEGLQLMKVGDKMRFWIPGKLAYEDPDKPKRPGTPQGTLVFDVELLDVSAAPPPGPGGGMSPQQMQQLQQHMQMQQQQQQQSH
ncbi:MAG: FKBP-type peptidyl-prolyl cis-trans isomerase [Polyangiaceae bacterium]